jgi:hypothetical protein
VFFSLGEMLTGPKKNEYLGLIAPKGKKGLYLGYVNIPVGVGVGIGSWIAGHVYDNYGEKASLALKYLGTNTQLVSRAAQAADWSDSLELIPGLLGIDRSRAFDLACEELRQDHDTAAVTLREAFRYDRGQVTNLGLQYLALQPEFEEKATAGLTALLVDDENAGRATDIMEKLSKGESTIDQIGVARFVDLLPKAIGIKRLQVSEVLRDLVKRDLAPNDRNDETAVIGLLWERFGDDPETLNNLAMEYLAQATQRMHRAVAAMTFDDPVRDIEEQLGIGRTKSFAALSAAMGADDAATEAALSRLQVPAGNADYRAYAYLMMQPHHRFIAVARKDWRKDIELLRQIIESDPAVTSVVLSAIDEVPWYGRLFTWGRDLFGGAQREPKSVAERLATKQNLIQKALAEKDWTKSPGNAARLLGLSPFEARALVAAEVNRSPATGTRLLWDTYHPQYKVWIPFAAIGVLATIALGIFGQLAKRWKDMNA